LEAELTGRDQSLAEARAAEPKVRYDLLARGIPASSYAVAANYVQLLGPDRNFDMALQGVTNGALPTPNAEFRHSDFKNVAMMYVRPVFEHLVQKGQLK